MQTIFFFPEMFLPHIKDSDLKIPETLDSFDLESCETDGYERFRIFIALHLGVPIDINYLQNNANIIANLSNEELEIVTMKDLLEKGFYEADGSYIV